MPLVERPDGSIVYSSEGVGGWSGDTGGVSLFSTPTTTSGSIPITWTATPNATTGFTYTTIGGNTMPTQAQIDVAQRNLDTATTDLTRQYFNIRLAVLQRPQVWSLAEAFSTARDVMRRNMEKGNHASSRDILYTRASRDGRITEAYQNLMTHRRYQYELGQSIRKAISDQDDEELVRILNDNDSIRDRNISDWVEMLNSGDRFNGPEYDYCSDCNYIEASDDGSWIYDGDRWVCSDCREENYRWSDYRDCVVHIDDYEDEEEEEEEEYEERSIGGYHSSRRKLGFIPTVYSERKTKVFLGLELEMEVVESDRYDKADTLMEEIGMYQAPDGKQFNYCFLEDDGSINHGFEMVTGYTGLDVHAKQLEFFKRPWANVKSHDTKTCGLHVHICKKGMTMFHAAKLILFMHDSRNQRLFRAIARRDANRYSQVKNKTADYAWVKHAKRNGMQALNDDRYEAVNFQPEKTVEFRLFKGTLRYETIMACLEFTYATWFFTRDTGQQDLTAENFLKYICQPNQRKDTVNLRSFLRSKGFSLDKSAIVKRNPRVEQDEPQQLAEV